jgi:DNA-binding IclR family transcriptional regulator
LTLSISFVEIKFQNGGVMGKLEGSRRKARISDLSVEDDQGQIVRSLARGLKILRAFRPGETALSNSTLAERTDLSRPTVSRLTATLTSLGYLSFVPDTGCYELGSGVVALCHSLLAGMPHRMAARPFLQELADYCHLPCSLGMRDQLEMVMIETVRHAGSRPARFDLGSRLPILTTSMGKAYLYALPVTERETLLSRLRAKVSVMQWQEAVSRLDASFEDLDKYGFCTSLGDRLPDVYAVAAPIVTPSGTAMALNCGGMPSEVTADRLQNDIGPRLFAIARQISSEPESVAQL